MVNEQGIDHYPYIGFRYDLFDIQRHTTLWVRSCAVFNTCGLALGAWLVQLLEGLEQGSTMNDDVQTVIY